MLLLSACARPPVPVVPPVEIPAGLEERLLEQLRTNAQAFYSLQGIARLKLDNGEGSRSVTQALWALKPDHLRAETLNPFGFGSPLLLLASDGAEVRALVPGEGRLYRAEATAENVRRFTRLPLRLTDLVHVLLYQVPVIPYSELALSAAEVGYRIEFTGLEGAGQTLLFDRQLRLVEASYFDGGQLLLRVGYDKFSQGGAAFPRETRLEMPQQQVTAQLAFSELETNVSIAPERFILEAPQGYEEVVVE